MNTQLKFYRKQWQSLNQKDRRSTALRWFLSALVFVIGCGIIFNMRAKLVGEDGATLAMYFLGVLFILTMNLMIFANKLRNPELFALKLCLIAVILTGAWVNLEEKVVMPLLSTNCHDDCVMTYERHVPFSDVELIYREGRGWRVLD
ncbi:MAG: hypothetical protein Phog2KO_06470 [Phototrophicaceae bacterium]